MHGRPTSLMPAATLHIGGLLGGQHRIARRAPPTRRLGPPRRRSERDLPRTGRTRASRPEIAASRPGDARLHWRSAKQA
eukprot:scaffold8082_cov258-Pinguiococcus_pyrenoidosus.AAC.2